MSRLVPIVRTKVEYVTEMVEMVPFLKRQPGYELVINRELHTVDLRLATNVDGYTHFVADIKMDQVDKKDLDSLYNLRSNNRLIEFVEKYQHHFNWKEEYKGCVLY